MKIRLTPGTFLLSLLFVVATFIVPLFNADAGFLIAAGAATMTEEEAKAALIAEIKSQVEKQMETRAKKEDIKAEITAALKQFEGLPLDELRKMADADKGVMAMLVKQGAEITALKETAGTREDLSVRSQVSKWMESNKESISKIKSGHKAELSGLQLRVAASPMTSSNTLNSSAYLPKPFFESGIHDLRRVQPTLWDYLPKGRTGQAAYVWVNKKDPDGAADFIGEGVAKPDVSFELETEISTAKKVAENLKCSTELLDDIDGMTTFIQDELRYALFKKVNTTLLSAVGSSTVPEGITQFATSFTAVGLSTDNPNNMDAIRAGIAQLRSTYFSEAVTVFMNPIDVANMDMAKADTSGVYLLPPFSTSDGRTVAGAVVVEDNNITQGNILFACLGLLKTLIYKDYTVTFGWENDDFTKNLVTAVGEMRLHFFHSSIDDNGFIYDALADIKTAISAS